MKKLFILSIIIPCVVSAQNSQGPLSPSLAENTSCPFSYSSMVDYLPAENAFASDDAYSTASHCDCCDANTRCFETKGYGFDIPLTATIDGILVEVEKRASGGSMVQDNGVKLIKAGSTVGTSQATTANWPSADTWFSYGSATDLWGTTWLAQDINDMDFGVALASISYTCFGNGSPVISYIDHVRITVYFTDIATSISPAANAKQLFIAPNPATGNTIKLSLPITEDQVIISITDMAGKKLDEKKVVVVSGHAVYDFDLPEGMLMVHVKGTVDSYAQKLLVE